MSQSSYKDLIAWQKGMELVAMVYDATEGFPTHEQSVSSANSVALQFLFPATLPKERRITPIGISLDFFAMRADP